MEQNIVTSEVGEQYPDEKLNKEIEILKIPPSLTRIKKKRRNLKVDKKIHPTPEYQPFPHNAVEMEKPEKGLISRKMKLGLSENVLLQPYHEI